MLDGIDHARFKKVKWMFGKEIEIPEEWEVKTLNDSCNILDSKRIPLNSEEREKIKGNIPYYGANGVQGYVNEHLFNEELILLAEDGGYFDEFETRPIAYYISGKSWVNNHAHVLSAKPNNALKWIFYSLVHKNILPWINESTRTKLNQSDLKQIQIHMPPLAEQQKIASILSGVDALIESTQMLIEKTETLKKGLMQKLLTRGIGHARFKKVKWMFGREIEIPEEWQLSTINQIATVHGRIGWKNLRSNEYVKTGFPMLSVWSLVENSPYGIDFAQSVKKLTQFRYDESPEIQLHNDDVLVAKDGDIGRIGFIKKLSEPATVNSHVVIVRTNHKSINPEFLYWFLKSKPFQTYCKAFTSGTTVPLFTQKDLRNFTISLPMLSEQARIASILSGVDAIYDLFILIKARIVSAIFLTLLKLSTL